MPFFPSKPSRRSFLRNSVMASATVIVTPALSAAREVSSAKPAAPQPDAVEPFELEEITISELQEGMKSGRFTARSLVEQYSARIDEVDTPHKNKRGPAVNAIIEMNPDALSIADSLDAERKARGPRGPRSAWR